MTAPLLDTCILIDLLRGSPVAAKAVRIMSETPYFCAVSTMELYAGARSQREEMRIERLLALFRQAEIYTAVYRGAGNILRHFAPSHGLSTADALIVATAEHHGLELATLNVKHFPMFPKLKPAY